MTQQQNNAKVDARKAGGGRSRADSIRLVLAALTAFVALAMVAFAIFSTAGPSGENAARFTPNDQGLIPTGNKAPSFDAETVGGGNISVGEGEAGATMLVFFATWCPHCNNEAPILSELARENEDLNVIMAGIDGQDDPQKVREFVEEYGIRCEALYQPSLGQTYQVTGYPTTYVIDEQGQIVGANAGETPKGVLQEWIDEAKT